MAPARVLVVDDSATMRGLISAVLNSDPEVNVIGQASDAMEARAAIKELNPDVVTLDIEMPNMNGLEFLEKIMKLRPMPVIMVSSLTHRGAEASIAALEIGAFDCIGKPAPGDTRPFHELIEKVKAAAKSGYRHQYTRAPQVQPAAPANANVAADYRVGKKIVAIGSSTGGVEALIEVLKKFPVNCPPTVITQHMPQTFTKSFAERLNRLCAPHVDEATDGARLEIGRIYLHPVASGIWLWPIRTLPSSGLSTSAGQWSSAVSRCPVRFGGRTGRPQRCRHHPDRMGRDGATGLLKMRHAGARTIGQNEKDLRGLWNAPRGVELGAVETQWPLNGIGDEILKLTAARKEGSD